MFSSLISSKDKNSIEILRKILYDYNFRHNFLSEEDKIYLKNEIQILEHKGLNVLVGEKIKSLKEFLNSQKDENVIKFTKKIIEILQDWIDNPCKDTNIDYNLLELVNKINKK